MDLGSREVVIFQVTKTLPDLGNGLKPFGYPLQKIIKYVVVFVGLQSVELGELF